MAWSAISSVKVGKPVRGIRWSIVDVDGPASYSAGGESVAPSVLLNYSGIGNINYLVIPTLINDDGTYEAQWDQSANKVVLYDHSTTYGTEASGDVSGVEIRLLIIGS
jgi:hypothetical protein